MSLNLHPKTAARSALHFLREATVRWQDGVQEIGEGRGRKVVFMPAYGREGAALLRIYKVAEGLKRSGWRVCVLPWKLTLDQRKRLLKAINPDVVVMQGVRHVFNRPAYYPGYPIVFDLDDADFHLPHLAEPVRDAMGQVHRVLAGSDYIARWCLKAGAAHADVVWTTAEVSSGSRKPQVMRPPVIAWAQTRPMTYKAEGALVARVMARVAAQVPGVCLRLYDRRGGDDPGYPKTFAAPGLSVEWVRAADYSTSLKSFDDVAIGLAPLCLQSRFSRGKGFGKILAYLDRKVVVVASDAAEPARFFTEETGALCGDEGQWVKAIVALLRDPGLRQAKADAGHAAFLRNLTLDRAVEQVSEILMRVVEEDHSPWSDVRKLT